MPQLRVPASIFLDTSYEDIFNKCQRAKFNYQSKHINSQWILIYQYNEPLKSLIEDKIKCENILLLCFYKKNIMEVLMIFKLSTI